LLPLRSEHEQNGGQVTSGNISKNTRKDQLENGRNCRRKPGRFAAIDLAGLKIFPLSRSPAYAAYDMPLCRGVDAVQGKAVAQWGGTAASGSKDSTGNLLFFRPPGLANSFLWLFPPNIPMG
jgi:hypothetical protein